MSEYASVDWPRHKGVPVAATDPFHYRSLGRLTVDEAWADWIDAPHNYRHWQQARARLNRHNRSLRQFRPHRTSRPERRKAIAPKWRLRDAFGRWARSQRLSVLGIERWERTLPDGRILSLTIGHDDDRWPRLTGEIRSGRHTAKVGELYDGFVCAIATIERLAGVR